MRRFCLALGGFLLVSVPMQAQQPGVDPNNERKMEEVLGLWEKAMTDMKSVETRCNRITNKKAFKTVDKYEGVAKMLKSSTPNQPCRASLELFKENRPEVFDKIICTGTYVFMYDSGNKVIKFADQPAPGTQGLTDNNFLDFLFGMKAGQAKLRYHIIYVPPTDKWYHYLKIVPKTDQDSKTFKEARVALNASNFLPRQLWFLQPNGDEVTWDFPQMIPNAEVRPQEFVTPELPAGGWKFEKMQR